MLISSLYTFACMVYLSSKKLQISNYKHQCKNAKAIVWPWNVSFVFAFLGRRWWFWKQVFWSNYTNWSQFLLLYFFHFISGWEKRDFHHSKGLTSLSAEKKESASIFGDNKENNVHRIGDLVKKLVLPYNLNLTRSNHERSHFVLLDNLSDLV